MSGRSVVPALGRGQLAARAMVVVLPVAALLVGWPTGGLAPVWLLGVVVLLSAGWAVRPGSAAGAVVLVVVLAWWGVRLGDDLDAWVLPAGAALLAAHVAATVLAHGPATMAVDGAFVRRWLGRTAVAYVAAPVVHLAAAAVRGAPDPGGVWVAGLVATCGALVGASLVLTSSDTGAGGTAGGG